MRLGLSHRRCAPRVDVTVFLGPSLDGAAAPRRFRAATPLSAFRAFAVGAPFLRRCRAADAPFVRRVVRLQRRCRGWQQAPHRNAVTLAAFFWKLACPEHMGGPLFVEKNANLP